VEIVKAIAGAGLKITPEIHVTGNQGSEGGGLVQALLAKSLHDWNGPAGSKSEAKSAQ
jgi:hypothetical protein